MTILDYTELLVAGLVGLVLVYAVAIVAAEKWRFRK